MLFRLTHPGPMKPFLDSSIVNLRVILSSSDTWKSMYTLNSFKRAFKLKNCMHSVYCYIVASIAQLHVLSCMYLHSLSSLHSLSYRPARYALESEGVCQSVPVLRSKSGGCPLDDITSLIFSRILMQSIFIQRYVRDRHMYTDGHSYLMIGMHVLALAHVHVLTEYCDGSILTPAFAPPKGTSTIAHLKVMRLARAFTSSSVTSGL